jgi:uncharacterized repeat protein (TIGR03803 family)
MFSLRQLVGATSKRRSLAGLLLFVGCALPANVAHAQTLTTLHSLQGPPEDGSWPCAGVTLDPAGNMYGTAQFGGESNYGVVFEVEATGAEAVLHSFVGSGGQNPCAPLIRSATGDLYGTTVYGGIDGNGTLFRMQGSALTVIYEFKGTPDGQGPFGGLVENIDGNLYGTTAGGGSGGCAGGCGTIYRVDRSGHETVVYSFDGSNGANPGATLIHDSEGNLYGTATDGGLNDSNQLCPGGCGTVFMLSRPGKFTCLHKFIGGTSDGWYVPAGLVRDAEGNLYGTTAGGGAWNGGVIYEITNSGKEKILYNFSGMPDGENPNQLTIANGKLYGTTYIGGQSDILCYDGGCGTIFEFERSGRESVLYRFGGINDGGQPDGPVTFDREGNMYGTTQSGIEDGCTLSQGGCGTIWKLSPN